MIDSDIYMKNSVSVLTNLQKSHQISSQLKIWSFLFVLSEILVREPTFLEIDSNSFLHHKWANMKNWTFESECNVNI